MKKRQFNFLLIIIIMIASSLVSANKRYVINFISFLDIAYAYRVINQWHYTYETIMNMLASRDIFPFRIFVIHLLYDRISYDISLHFTISSSTRVDINIII